MTATGWLAIGLLFLNVIAIFFIRELINVLIKSKTADTQDFKLQISKLTEDYRRQLNSMSDRFMSFNAKVFEIFKDYDRADKDEENKPSEITQLEGKEEGDEDLQELADKEGKKIQTLDDLSSSIQ